MRILVISNLYPPHAIGGCELHCKEVVDELRRLGHTVSVLTSTYGIEDPETTPDAHRILSSRLAYSARVRKNRGLFAWRLLIDNVRDNRVLKHHIAQFQPDVISIWNSDLINKSLLKTAETSGIPVSYMVRGYYCLPDRIVRDPWLGVWMQRTRFGIWNATRRMLARTRFDRLIDHLAPIDVTYPGGFYAVYNSHATLAAYRAAGVDTCGSIVIYGGLPLDQIPVRDPSPLGNTVRLLYAGRIGQAKGVHTIIEALSILVNQRNRRNITVTLVGGNVDTTFEDRLRSNIAEWELTPFVTFTGMMPKANLLRLYSDFDIFVFPSTAEEPYGWTLREAMAAGLPVIGTLVGGAAEILCADVTCLSFPPGDAIALANQIELGIDNQDLLDRIAGNGRRAAIEQCSFAVEIERFLSHLQQVIGSSGRTEGGRQLDAQRNAQPSDMLTERRSPIS